MSQKSMYFIIFDARPKQCSYIFMILREKTSFFYCPPCLCKTGFLTDRILHPPRMIIGVRPWLFNYISILHVWYKNCINHSEMLKSRVIMNKEKKNNGFTFLNTYTIKQLYNPYTSRQHTGATLLELLRTHTVFSARHWRAADWRINLIKTGKAWSSATCIGLGLFLTLYDGFQYGERGADKLRPT